MESNNLLVKISFSVVVLLMVVDVRINSSEKSDSFD